MPDATPDRGNVLLVDDEVAMGDYFVEGLASAGFGAAAVRSGEQALAYIEGRDFDALVTDVRMKGMDGLELCRRVRESTAELPVIVLTAFGDYAVAVEAVRAGAYDFLSKPVKLDVLTLALARAVESRRLRREVKALQASRSGRRFGELIGDSTAMRKVHDLLTRVARADVSELVTGENGTGKEHVARATEFVTLEEMEKRYILQILEAVGGSKSVAARTLGLDRTTLWRKLERYQGETGKQGKG